MSAISALQSGKAMTCSFSSGVDTARAKTTGLSSAQVACNSDSTFSKPSGRAFDLGLVVYFSQGCADGVNGDIIMIGPPLIINREQIDDLVDILAEAIKQELRT